MCGTLGNVGLVSFSEKFKDLNTTSLMKYEISLTLTVSTMFLYISPWMVLLRCSFGSGTSL